MAECSKPIEDLTLREAASCLGDGFSRFINWVGDGLRTSFAWIGDLELRGLGTVLGLSLAAAMCIFTVVAIVAIIKDNWRRFRLRRQGVDPDER